MRATKMEINLKAYKENMKKIQEYVPGKKNPFAPVQTEVDSDSSGENSGSTSTDNSSSNNTGSLFEKPGTK